MNSEIWKELEEFNGKYLISTLGRLKSMPNKRYKTEHIIKGTIDKKGYLRIRLRKKDFLKCI